MSGEEEEEEKKEFQSLFFFNITLLLHMVIYEASAKVNMLKETAYGSVCVCALCGSSRQTTAFTLALDISWKTNTISHLLWGCRKQFETSSTCVVCFTAYLCWIKSARLYSMHVWNLFSLTSGKHHRWFQFELFSLTTTSLSCCKVGHNFQFLI